MMSTTFILAHDQARARAAQAVKDAPEGWSVVLRPPRRSTQANARFWAMLTEVSEHVEWHGQQLTPEEWKDVFSAALKRQAVVPGIDGGFVVLGARTSKMSVAQMSELMELITAFGVERGVPFRDM